MKNSRFITRFRFAGNVFAILVGSILFAWLAYSVAVSGLHYQFDIDEFYFAQQAYLYMNGYQPYTQVYTSVYPPVFTWLTIPVFMMTGFSLKALFAVRYVMIALLAIRILFLWMAIRIIFSPRTALLFLPLFLFNPFGVFAMMQYRPDNLMLTLFAVGLYFFARGMTDRSVRHISAAGFFMSASVLTLSKIAPSVAVIGFIFVAYTASKKRLGLLFPFIFWAIVPVASFCIYLIFSVSFGAMIQQTFVDIRALYTNFTIPIAYNAMMHPDNAYIFGVMGKPATWVYLWLIAPLGCMGVYHEFRQFVSEKTHPTLSVVRLMLAVACILQWSALFIVQVAFIQHYMPFHGLAIIFMAYAIDEFLESSRHDKRLYIPLSVTVITVLLFLTKVSIPNNFLRSTITGEYTNLMYENRWKQIPPSEGVFPGFLFRPPTFPLPYGGFIVNMPASILTTLPDIATLLEKQKPRLLLDDYTLARLPVTAQQYIYGHYTRVPGDPELMELKK